MNQDFVNFFQTQAGELLEEFMRASQKNVKKQEKAKMKVNELKEMIQEQIEQSIPYIVEQVKSLVIDQQKGSQSRNSQKQKLNWDQLEDEFEQIGLNTSIPQAQKDKDEVIQEKPKQIKHQGVICDGCQMNPIMGIRYKCSVCIDFDLCEKCEASNNHDITHPFLKIKNTQQTPLIVECSVFKQEKQCETKEAKLSKKEVRKEIKKEQKEKKVKKAKKVNIIQEIEQNILEENNYLDKQIAAQNEEIQLIKNQTQIPKKEEDAIKVNHFNQKYFDKLIKEQKQNDEKTKQKQQEKLEKERIKAEKKLQKEQDKLIKQQKLEQKIQKIKTDKSVQPKPFKVIFIEYQNLPFEVNSSQNSLTTKLTVKNCGASTWPENTYLYSKNGFTKGQSYLVGKVEPNQSLEIELKIETPKEAGNYQSTWKLGYLDNEFIKYFGSKVTYNFNVKESAEINQWEKLPEIKKVDSAKQSQENDIQIDCLFGQSKQMIEKSNQMLQFLGGDLKKYVDFIKLYNLEQQDINDIVEQYFSMN